MKLGKKEIVERYAEIKEITKKEAEKNLEDTLDVIKTLIGEGNDVSLFGFGNFEVRETKAREGRNPSTGEIIDIPAGRKVAFKASKKLKELV